jgi:hypothetical protein
VDAGRPPSGHLDRVLQEGGGGTASRGRRHLDARQAVLDRDAVDQPEIDDVLAELGIDDGPQRLFDRLDGRLLAHDASSGCAPARMTTR